MSLSHPQLKYEAVGRVMGSMAWEDWLRQLQNPSKPFRTLPNLEMIRAVNILCTALIHWIVFC